jgi:hypothetical protein
MITILLGKMRRAEVALYENEKPSRFCLAGCLALIFAVIAIQPGYQCPNLQ